MTSFKTHDLEVLLQLSGIGTKIRSKFPTEWDELADWDPEMRYNRVGSTAKAKAKQMIDAAKALLRQI